MGRRYDTGEITRPVHGKEIVKDVTQVAHRWLSSQVKSIVQSTEDVVIMT